MSNVLVMVFCTLTLITTVRQLKFKKDDIINDILSAVAWTMMGINQYFYVAEKGWFFIVIIFAIIVGIIQIAHRIYKRKTIL